MKHAMCIASCMLSCMMNYQPFTIGMKCVPSPPLHSEYNVFSKMHLELKLQ